MKNQNILQLAAAIEELPALKSAPKATYALARNLTKLKPLRQDVLDTRQKIFEEKFELAPGQKYDQKYPITLPTDVPAQVAQQIVTEHLQKNPKYPEVDKAFQEVLKMEVEFSPYTFDIEELNLEVNPISAAHLEVLLPLIKETPGKNGAP